MIALFGLRAGPCGGRGGGTTFPARGRVPGLLGSRSGLQGQRSPVSSRKGAGRTGERGAGGATTVSSAPGDPWQGTQLVRDLLLCPHHFSCFFFFFFKSEGAWGRGGRKGSPSPGPRHAVWGDRLTLCFGAWVVLPLSQFYTKSGHPFPFLQYIWGVALKGS